MKISSFFETLLLYLFFLVAGNCHGTHDHHDHGDHAVVLSTNFKHQAIYHLDSTQTYHLQSCLTSQSFIAAVFLPTTNGDEESLHEAIHEADLLYAPFTPNVTIKKIGSKEKITPNSRVLYQLLLNSSDSLPSHDDAHESSHKHDDAHESSHKHDDSHESSHKHDHGDHGDHGDHAHLRRLAVNPKYTLYKRIIFPPTGALSFSSLRFLLESECGGKGHLHGTSCHCNSGYITDPSNPRNCIVEECTTIQIGVQVDKTGTYGLFLDKDVMQNGGNLINTQTNEALTASSCTAGCALSDTDSDVATINRSQKWLLSLLGTLITSICALAGLPIVLFSRGCISNLLGIMTSFASGALIGAVFFHVYPEATEYLSGLPTWKQGICAVSGVILGIVMEQGIHMLLKAAGHEHVHTHHISDHDLQSPLPQEHKHTPNCNSHEFHSPRVHDEKRGLLSHLKTVEPVAWTMIFAGLFHKFTDGVLIATAFSGCSTQTGWIVTVVVCAHECPHEIGNFFVLMKAGMTAYQAAFFNFFTSISSFLGVIILLSVGTIADETLGFNLAIGSGILLFIGMTELLPAMMEEGNMRKNVWNFLFFLIGALLPALLMLSHTHCHSS